MLMALHSHAASGAARPGAKTALPSGLLVSLSAPKTVPAAGRILWAITLQNEGPGIARGVVARLSFSQAIAGLAAPARGCFVARALVTCSVAELAVGGSIRLPVTGRAPAAARTCFEGTATIASDGSNATAATCTSMARPSLTWSRRPVSGHVGGAFSASVSLRAGAAPKGTLRFEVFGPRANSCSGSPLRTVSVPAVGDGTYASGQLVLRTGHYSWTASYGGDRNNVASGATPCVTSTVIKTSPPACTDSWAGASTGGAWGTPANWSSGLPAANAVVCINGVTGTVTFDGTGYAGTGGVASIGVLISSAPLDIAGGELTFTNTGVQSSTDGLTMTSGMIGDQTTAIAGLLDNGAFTWSGGYFESPPSESPQPVLTESGGFTATISTSGTALYNWTLSLASQLNVSSSTSLQTGSSIQDSAAVTLANNASISGATSSSFDILPNGSLTLAASQNTASISVPVQVNGPITLLTGDSLTLGDGQLLPSGSVSGSVAAPLTVPSSATLVLNAVSLQSAATNSGAGTIQLENNLLDEVPLTTANVTEAGPGVTTAFAGLNITGAFTVSGGEFDPLASSNSVGTLTVSGGQVGDTVNAVGNLAVAGNFAWTGASFYAPAGQYPQPTMTESAGTASIASPSYLQHWTLDLKVPLALTGAFQFVDGGSIDAESTVSVGTSTNVEDSYSSAGPFIAAGLVTLATVSGTATISVPVQFLGGVKLPTANSAEALVLGNGQQGSGSVQGTVSIGSNSTLTLDGVSLPSGSPGASFPTPAGAGTLALNGNDVVQVPIKIATLIEQGGYTLASAGISVTTLNVTGGELDPAAGTTTSANTMTLSGGQIGDTSNLVGGVTVTAGVTWSGGSLYAPSGELPQPVLAAGGAVNQSGSTTLAHWTLNVGKNFGITGTIYSQYGGSINVAYDGNSVSPNIVSVAAGATVYDYNTNSSGLFTSAVQVELASGTASIQMPINFSDGVSFVTGGTLTLGNSSVPSGSINTKPFSVGTGGLLILDNVNIGSGATNSGAGTLELQGTVAATPQIDVQNVTEDGSVTYADAGLNIGGTLTVTTGELDPLAASTVGALTMTGGQIGDITSTVAGITDNGALTWTGGNFIAPAGEVPQPSVTTSTNSQISNPGSDLNWALDVSSPASLTLAGTFDLGEDGTINASGPISITTALNIYDYAYNGYGGYINASGPVSVGVATGTAIIQVPVQVTGGLTVSQGTLQLGTSGQAYGAISGQSFSVATGATLNLYNVNLGAGATNSGLGTLDLNGSVTSAVPINIANVTEQSGVTYAQSGLSISGTLLVSSGEFDPYQATNSVGALTVSGGQVGDAVTNTGSIAVSGPFNWTGGTFVAPAGENPQPSVTTSAGSNIANPSYDFNWALDLSGTLALSGSFDLGQDGTINASGLVTITAGTNIVDYYGNNGYGGYFNSTGGMNVNLSTGTATIAVPVSITGGLTVQAGALTLGNGQTFGSISQMPFTVGGNGGTPTGATLELDGVNIGAGATNSGTGTLFFDGTVNSVVPINVNNVTQQNGTTTASDGIQISGPLKVTGGEFDPLAGSAGNSVGELDLSGGQIGDTVSDPTSIAVAGAFNWTGGYFYAPAGENPQPTITTSSASTVNTGGYTDSSWALDFNGPLALSGSNYLQNGGTIVAAGAVTVADATTMGNGGNTTAGPFVITSTGSMTLPLTAGSGVTFNVSLENSGILNLGQEKLTMNYGFYLGSSGSTLETRVSGLNTGQYGTLVCGVVQTALGGTFTAINNNWTPASGQLINVVTNTTSANGFGGTAFTNATSNGWTLAQVLTNSGNYVNIQLQG